MDSTIIFLSLRQSENIFGSSHLELGQIKQFFEGLTQPELARPV
jgi:hypothetical protein